jgi:phosphoribosylanthranilate isomerase
MTSPHFTVPNFVVKVCGITRREDAEVAAEAGASAIGFIFYPKSPRYVAPELAAKLGEGLPLWKVGVFVNEPPATIAAVMSAALLDVVQIYGGGAPPHSRVWKAFRLAASGEVGLAVSGRPEAVLFDGLSNGLPTNWDFARRFGETHKVIVAGGLDASNVGDAIRATKPWGVDASSSMETSPGVKDHEKIRGFVRAALHAGREIGMTH